MKKNLISTTNITGFDAHCHIFNISYLLKEAKEIFFHWVIGNYPNEDGQRSKGLFKSDDRESFKSKLKDLLKQIYELGSACVDTEEDNFLFIRDQAKSTWNIELGAIPLMMDIYYYFAPPVTEDTQTIAVNKAFKINKEFNEAEFEEDFAEIVDEVFNPIIEKNVSRAFKNDKFSKSLKTHIEEAKNNIKYQYTSKNLLYNKLFLTNGFKYHLDNLVNIVNKGYPIYPFLAVDPRRPGILDAICGDSLVSKNGPFYGVKLYPRLGYHPKSEPVKDILDICKERDLPVTVHCGKSGFPPGVKWQYAEYGNPANFEDSLDDKLRINFAHFGSNDDVNKLGKITHPWADTIIDYMNTYDNVYSDLSCYTNSDDLKKIYDMFWNDKSKIKDRMMYGSDYDVMYFTDRITLGNYYQNFSNIFKLELNKMRYDVPKKFLKID